MLQKEHRKILPIIHPPNPPRDYFFPDNISLYNKGNTFWQNIPKQGISMLLIVKKVI